MMETLVDDSVLRISRVVTAPLDNNVYVLQCAVTRDAVMIDAPGGDPDLLSNICSDLGIETVLVTHGHFDHVGSIDRLRRAGVEVGIATADVAMTEGIDFEITDGDVFPVGELSIGAVATPGHTPGSTCFVVEDRVVFTGDTLFPGGPGATRWPYSSFETIIESIETRLLTLPGDTVVFPGHGASTTIATERPVIAHWRSIGA